MSVAATPELTVPLDATRAQLEEAVRSLETLDAAGEPPLYDAIALAIEQLRTDPSTGRRGFVIAFTGGGDATSRSDVARLIEAGRGDGFQPRIPIFTVGYAPGGDAMGVWGAITWLPGSHGGQLSVESLTRVGVVEALEDNLLTLSTDERRLRVGASGWMSQEDGTWLRLEVSVERIEGVDFVPGVEELRYRVALSRG